MKSYIGTKHILAEPMKCGEAYQKGFIRENSYDPANADNDGYHILYDDGYQSWSPKETFDESYEIAETPLDRMAIESDELVKKTEKLLTFINNNSLFGELSVGIQAALLGQSSAMSDYIHFLEARRGAMIHGEEEKLDLKGMNFERALPLLKEGFAIRRSGWNGKGLMVFKQVPAHITSEIIPKMQSLPEEAKRLILAHTGFIDYTNQCLIYDSNIGEANSWVPSISDVFANDWELVLD